ncbi:hypothetical protein ACICHK_41210 (plasmid) [Streptomyces sp. AHU1]|uniref:hypothetical protein n=1 Tax=Streptomyces sp. AHU1 TaxID=3377215 RepID=UPI0038780CF3
MSIQSAHNGVTIVIDDCGVGMLEDEMRQAAELFSGERGVDVTRLGDPPAFGHAVIGRLAARYGFRAYADSVSPFGGLRAAIFLPSALLIPVDQSTDRASVQAARFRRERLPAATASRATDRTSAETPAAPVPLTEDGLPQRRRRRPAAADSAAIASEAPQVPAVRSARRDAATLGALQRGSRAGRGVPTPRIEELSADGGPGDTERQSQ